MIKAVIFDIDNTLYNYDRCNEYAYSKLEEFMVGMGINPEKFNNAFSKARNDVKKQLGYNYASRHNRILYCQKCAEMLGLNVFNISLDMYKVYWDNFLEKAELYNGAGEFLDRLNKYSISTALCTDMTAHIQLRKILKLGIQNKINCMVSSEEAGEEKPSEIIYKMTAEKLKVKPNECIYIGDDYKRDIVGAKNIGMIPIYFSSEKIEDIYCFGSYKEISDFFVNEGIFKKNEIIGL